LQLARRLEIEPAAQLSPIAQILLVSTREADTQGSASHALHTLLKALVPRPTSVTRTTVRAYGLAVVAAMTSIAITRSTWPLFAGTPFVALFGAVVVATQWGSGATGLLAMALTVVGAPLAFPAGAPSPWTPRTLVIFVITAVVANRIVAGRNRMETALRASEDQLRATWEHAPLGTALLDRLGGIERINPALDRLLGYSQAACAGMSFTAFSDPAEAAAEQERFTALVDSTDAFYQREQRYRRRDGTFLWGRVTVSIIRGPDAVATGAVAVLEDVSAQRQAEVELRASEQHLRQAHKMEAIGQLVAGVAHNFNNLLAVTMGYTDLLLARHSDHPLDQSDLKEIYKATERGAALTRQLLAFGRKHDATPVRIDLNRTVAGIRELLTRVIREDIQLEINVPSVALAIVIDPSDLEQVILNLVINSRDALPGGGTIHVDVSQELIATARIFHDSTVVPGEYVRLRVQDNGVGMTTEVQSHVFEPFFTTKEVGHGTGLGLAFVHGIAHRGGGFVSIESTPAKGTCVSVYFPSAPGAVAEASGGRAASPAGQRHEATVLLVEDEEPVAIMMATMLTRAGYRVLSAGTPGEACSIFDQHSAEIDLLLTDIVMPEMNGPALAQRLVAQRRDLRVLFVSGYSEAMPTGAAVAGKTAYLAKPFPSHSLVSVVSELLAAATV
jgi:two-component system cell cycle sensor histidine kinase/response regulator CckA